MARLPQPSLDSAAELFCNSPETITKSVKYSTAVNIDIEKTSIGILSMSYGFTGH
jgi:hypothetical protein